MPIFDYKCPECGGIKKDVFVKHWATPIYCKGQCYSPDKIVKMEKLPSRFFADVFPSEGIFLEHVSPEGKTFHSKKEMRQYAREHDLELGAL
jgi:hypothetical protein